MTPWAVSAALREESQVGANSFETLLPLQGRAYHLAARILDSSSQAEDAVQQAYLKALQHPPERVAPGELRTWFLTVVANTARDQRRRRAVRRRREAEVRPSTEGVANGEEPNLQVQLRCVMAALDEKYRVPICLCYEQDLSQREAAAILDMPERTLSRYVSTGLGELRKALERAGYAALPAAILAGLKQTAPAAPASLAGRVEALVAKGAGASGAGGAATAVASAAKGGLTMRIIAGIVLAAAAAAGVAVVSGGRGEHTPLGSAAPSGAVRELPHDGRYRLATVHASKRGVKGGDAGSHRLDNPGLLNGPGVQASCSAGCGVMNVDGAGNGYWGNKGTWPEVRRWDVVTGMVTAVAGSACGYLDGPVSRARFSGWGYNGGANICASRDGQHVFLRDSAKSSVWRHIDREAGMVKTVTPFTSGGANNVIVRDKSGDVYAFRTDGTDMPDCPGYKKLKVARFKGSHRGKPTAGIGGFISGWALDAENMKFYWHGRGAPAVCDLKTGEVRCLTPRGKTPRGSDTTGPFEGMSWHCPTGMSISPGGRYLFMGGGDSGSFYRLDLEKKKIDRFARLEPGIYGWAEGHEKAKGHWITNWPGAAHFVADGSATWGGSFGIMRITPVGK